MTEQSINKEIRDFLSNHNNSELSMLELLTEFCLKSGLSEDEVGDIVASDEDLVNLLMFDLNSKNSNLENF